MEVVAAEKVVLAGGHGERSQYFTGIIDQAVGTGQTSRSKATSLVRSDRAASARQKLSEVLWLFAKS